MKPSASSLRIAWSAVLLSSLRLAARCPVPGQTFSPSADGARSFGAAVSFAVPEPEATGGHSIAFPARTALRCGSRVARS